MLHLFVFHMLQVYNLDHVAPVLRPLQLPDGLRLAEALHRVLRLPSVASKRYLTNKVGCFYLLDFVKLMFAVIEISSEPNVLAFAVQLDRYNNK